MEDDMEFDIVCRHYFISGKVQGVWFRDSTRTKAKSMQITGWVRNLPDGRVEAVVCGEGAVLEEFHEWLKQGPEQAEVTDITYEEIESEAYDTFEVR